MYTVQYTQKYKYLEMKLKNISPCPIMCNYVFNFGIYKQNYIFMCNATVYYIQSYTIIIISTHFNDFRYNIQNIYEY